MASVLPHLRHYWYLDSSRSETLRAHHSHRRLGFTPRPIRQKGFRQLQEDGFPQPSAATVAAARGASHTAVGATRGVRGTSKAASANRTSPTAIAASIGEVGAHTATVGGAATADACITIYQATPAVAGDTTRAAAADGRPPDDGGATRDTRGGQNTTVISDQAGVIDATKALTGDASRGAGGGRLGTRIEPRAATTAAKDSVADTRRDREAPRTSPGKLLRVLRGLDVPNRPSRRLSSSTPPALLYRPPRHGGDTPAFPGEPRDRNS